MVNVFTKWPKTNKDVQRGRATDANYLASDMDQLRKNLFDVHSDSKVISPKTSPQLP
eukprot:m.56911 g.56911  ORF g.56911 m.56911 type:complete len:57 (+) comp22310_c1_seq4:702-872(+)